MRKLLLAAAVALSLGGCANNPFTKVYDTLTGATVNATTVYVARNAFDAAEASATNYINFCIDNPRTTGCYKRAINALKPAIRSGRVARNNLRQFERDHPGQLGPTGLYDALVTSTNTIQSISNQYNIGAVGK